MFFYFGFFFFSCVKCWIDCTGANSFLIFHKKTDLTEYRNAGFPYPVEPTCSQPFGTDSTFPPGTSSQLKTVGRNTDIIDFLYLLVSQWIQGSQGHAQHLKDWSRREQSSRHCVRQWVKNLGTDFCQQQVKAARVCCLPGRIHIQLFGDKQYKNNICMQQGGSRPAFQTAEEACRPVWYV